MDDQELGLAAADAGSRGATNLHTPGPWRVDPFWPQDIQTEDGCEIGCSLHRLQIGNVWTIRGEITATTAEAEANARLIAAAPELLEALTAVLDVVAQEGAGSAFISGSLERKARAAIAKAEGQTPQNLEREAEGEPQQNSAEPQP